MSGDSKARTRCKTGRHGASHDPARRRDVGGARGVNVMFRPPPVPLSGVRVH